MCGSYLSRFSPVLSYRRLVFLLVSIVSIGFLLYLFYIYSPSLVIVASNSMVPSLMPGDLLLVVRVDSDGISVGDVITFRVEIPFIGERLVTHRVVDVLYSDGSIYYITKGDGNRGPDSWRIPYEQVVGKVVFRFPYLGFLLIYVRSLIVPVSSLIAGVLIIYISLFQPSPTGRVSSASSHGSGSGLFFDFSDSDGYESFSGMYGDVVRDLNDLLVRVEIAKSLIGRDDSYAIRILDSVSRSLESRIVEEDLKRIFRAGFRKASN